jgi:hypothetical protein
MAILNVTYGGRSADVPWDVDDRLSDEQVKGAAAEALREPPMRRALHLRPGGPEPGAFTHFVVDRINGPDGVLRLYLRPKVPFGC